MRTACAGDEAGLSHRGPVSRVTEFALCHVETETLTNLMPEKALLWFVFSKGQPGSRSWQGPGGSNSLKGFMYVF